MLKYLQLEVRSEGLAQRMTVCAEPCPHTDCASRHQVALMGCRICRRSIGYNLPFFRDTTLASPAEGYVHVVCLAAETQLIACGAHRPLQLVA